MRSFHALHLSMWAFIRAMRSCPDEFVLSRGMDMTVTVTGVDPMTFSCRLVQVARVTGARVANVFWSLDARALSGTGVGVACRCLFAEALFCCVVSEVGLFWAKGQVVLPFNPRRQ